MLTEAEKIQEIKTPQTVRALARMRGLQQAADELKKLDPETAITITALRRLVKQGAIPSIKVGKKVLINMDNLTNFMNGTYAGCSTETTGTIRSITE